MKNSKPKEKTYFDVKIDVMVPATIIYRVLSEDAEKAVEEITGSTTPANVKYFLNKKQIKKTTVFDAGCSVIKFIKNNR